MHFIGIDLAWSERNSSGGAAIESQGKQGKLTHSQQRVKTDDEIINFVSMAAEDKPAIVGIDAPLLVPNTTGSRPCDQEVTKAFARYHAGAFPANRNRFQGRVRGEELVYKLAALGFTHSHFIPRQAKVRQVVEVYPHPATINLFNLPQILKYKPRKGRSTQYRQKELDKLQYLITTLAKAEPALHMEATHLSNTSCLTGSAFKSYEDFLDAILCAYIVYYAWYWGSQRYHIYGDLENGYILVPTRK